MSLLSYTVYIYYIPYTMSSLVPILIAPTAIKTKHMIKYNKTIPAAAAAATTKARDCYFQRKWLHLHVSASGSAAASQSCVSGWPGHTARDRVFVSASRIRSSGHPAFMQLIY